MCQDNSLCRENKQYMLGSKECEGMQGKLAGEAQHQSYHKNLTFGVPVVPLV